MARKGQKTSEETKRKMSEAQKGKPRPPLSPEVRERMLQRRSESLKKAYATGKRTRGHTDETKAKISENRKGKALNNKNALGHEPFNKGKPHNVHTQEWRNKVSQANSGPNHWNWQGGIDSINRVMRNSTLHKNWAKAVHEKCGWTCQICGYKGKNIVAHHIKPWSHDFDLRFDVSNGITLCRSCHCRRHSPRTGTGKSPKPQSV